MYMLSRFIISNSTNSTSITYKNTLAKNVKAEEKNQHEVISKRTHSDRR